MRKLIIATMLTATSVAAFAMPTKAELKTAQPLVVELMAPAMEKYKSAPFKEKAAAAAKVADASAEFAKAAETEAAKFLLLKGAVSFYARGEQYDKAAETVTTLQRAIKDVPPAVIAEITGKATGRISETKAPALYALYRTAKLQVRASEEAKALAAKLKKTPSDALQRKYAEALAVSGDWKSAYTEFAKVRDAKLQAIVKDESSGNAKNAEAGEFWWSYEPAMEDAEDFFKSHAAAFYRRALEAGEITGLKKNLIEQRIKDVKPEIAVGEASSLPTTKSTASAMVRQDAAPTASGKAWQEKGNTAWLTLPNGEKLEFAKCPAGTGPILYKWKDGHVFFHANISRPFWIMKIPLQGKNTKGLPDPLDLRGGDILERKRDNIDVFCETLSEEFRQVLPKNYVLRLPSFVEWQYAYTEGGKAKTPPYNCLTRHGWGDKVAEVWYEEIRIPKKQNRQQSRANGWGISHWHVVEKILDCMIDENCKFDDKHRRIEFLSKPNDVKDPLWWGTVSAEADEEHDGQMVVCNRSGAMPQTERRGVGVARLVIGPDLVSEWKAKHGKK